MDHHLKHRLNSDFRSIYDLTEESLSAVKKSVEFALENNYIMEEWEKIFNFLEKVDSVDGFDKKVPTSYTYVNNTKLRSRHDYLMKDKNDNLMYVDGMCNITRKIIPFYSDSMCLGSILAGLHGKSIESSIIHFEDYKNYYLAQLGKTLKWFNNDVIDTNYSDEEYKNKKFWKNKYIIEDINTFAGIINRVNNYEVKELLNLRNVYIDIKEFYKEKVKYEKMNNGRLNYIYEENIDLNDDILFNKIKIELVNITNDLNKKYDLTFAKKNEERVANLRNEKRKKYIKKIY